MAKKLLSRIANRTPPLFIQNKVANILGLQIVRIFYLNFFRYLALGFKKVPRKQTLFSQDGVLVLPNFLPQDLFQEVYSNFKKKLEENFSEMKPTIDRNGETIIEGQINCDSPIINEFIVKNEEIRCLIEYTTKRKINKEPAIHYWFAQKSESSLIKKHEERTYYADDLHPDVCYPSVKVWLLLSDITKENGAYTYSKSSHKISLKKILSEYILSFKNSKLGTMTDDEALRLGYEITPIEGTANTLVISNQMGLHRRGHFNHNKAREMVHIDFRYLESWGNRLAKFF